jgi:immune inhibitor A
MRRMLWMAVLLLPALCAAPAHAVAPNEVLIAKHFAETGLIPPYADATMAQGIVHGVVGPGPSDQVRSPLAKRVLEGKQTPMARYLAPRVAGARGTTTYVTRALVLLVEFGDEDWPAGSPTPTGPMTAGPEHGNIPAPSADDNATFWPGDFSPSHYQQMLFGQSYPIYAAGGALRGTSDTTMRTWYLEQSHGAFTADGTIGNWVKLDMPESWYGADSDPWVSVDDLTGPAWRVARDAVEKFAADNPGFDWSHYDQENPYGIMPGSFHQPDGYIDHLILVHAGSDQSAGGGAQDSDAIWAHSGGIYENTSGGPGNLPGMMIPGTAGQGPQGQGIWTFPYTIDPEDGEPGVFCHEFGHDLGLPDEYDYTGVTGDASGFWTIMADGSWLGRQWGLGSDPGPFNVWDKSALGFIAPRVVKRGTTRTVKLRSASTGSPTSTGVKIPLPQRTHVIRLSGRDRRLEWYSGYGNNLDNRLTTKSTVAVPGGAQAVLTLRTWYNIENGYDYGYVLASDDGGASWTTLASAGHTVEVAPGVYGLTGSDTSHWSTTISYDLSAFAGENVLLQFRYVTDEIIPHAGWEIRHLRVGDTPLPAAAFSAIGWRQVDGSFTKKTTQYYIAEYRNHRGADAALRNCYQWNGLSDNWVDWFSYNRGLHLIYRDTFYSDNNVGTHPGRGGWLVVDARPGSDSVTYAGRVGFWRPRIQLRDAAFGRVSSPSQSIWFSDYDAGLSVGERIAPGKKAQSWFRDTHGYWHADTPETGVKIPRRLGVRIHVVKMTSGALTIWVDNRK